jgi:hypothetical protein
VGHLGKRSHPTRLRTRLLSSRQQADGYSAEIFIKQNYAFALNYAAHCAFKIGDAVRVLNTQKKHENTESRTPTITGEREHIETKCKIPQ